MLEYLVNVNEKTTIFDPYIAALLLTIVMFIHLRITIANCQGVQNRRNFTQLAFCSLWECINGHCLYLVTSVACHL